MNLPAYLALCLKADAKWLALQLASPSVYCRPTHIAIQRIALRRLTA